MSGAERGGELLAAAAEAGDGFLVGGGFVDGDAVHAVHLCGHLAEFFCWGGGLGVATDAAKKSAGA